MKFIKKVQSMDISKRQKRRIINAYYKEMGYKGIDMYEYRYWLYLGGSLTGIAIGQMIPATMKFPEVQGDSIIAACVTLLGGLISFAYGNEKSKEYKKYRIREGYTYINVANGNEMDYHQILQRYGTKQIKSLEYDEENRIGKVELKYPYG